MQIIFQITLVFYYLLMAVFSLGIAITVLSDILYRDEPISFEVRPIVTSVIMALIGSIFLAGFNEMLFFNREENFSLTRIIISIILGIIIYFLTSVWVAKRMRKKQIELYNLSNIDLESYVVSNEEEAKIIKFRKKK